MKQHSQSETFVVGEIVEMYLGEEHSQVKVVAVNSGEVIVDVKGREEKFRARPSDGKHVALGHEDYTVMPDLIFHATPEQKTSRWKDVRDFIHGMFWGA